MKRIFAFLVYTFGLSAFASVFPLSSGQFTQAVVKALGTAHPEYIVVIQKDLELSINDSNGEGITSSLDNAYRVYLRNPQTVDETINTVVSSIVESVWLNKAAPAIDRSRIVPVIKTHEWLKHVSQAVYEELNQDLFIVYGEDTPTNIRYLKPEDLVRIGIPRNQLRALAVENLKRLIPKPEIHSYFLGAVVTAGGDYEASLLLFDDLWSGFPNTDGEIVVAVPARDSLAFTGSRNQQGIAKLREFANKFARESPYRLTDKLFVYRNGSFVRFE